MIVVFAEKLPASVRGKMKLWFVEPTPNVFVSSVSDALASVVADQLYESCPSESNMLIVRSKRGVPGYVLTQKTGMQQTGTPDQNKLVTMTGLQLVKTIVKSHEEKGSR